MPNVSLPPVRCFVALQPPPDLRDRLTALTTALPIADWRPVPAGNLHVTLKFLGPTPADHLDSIQQIISSAAAAFRPFSLRPTTLTPLPRPRRPRLLVLDHESDHKLTALVKHLDTALQPLGFARERRPFRPHITLARLKGKPRRVKLQLPALPDSVQPWQADMVHLMKSHLHPQGAVYESIHQAPLA